MLLELKSQALTSQVISKWRCAQLLSLLWLCVKWHIFNHVKRSYSFHTNCSLYLLYGSWKPLALMTQQMVSAFIPWWFSTQLHTEPAACCSYPAPAAALLWHYSLQSQNFTVIHVSFQLPVGLLITIFKMHSDTKVKNFHGFFSHVCWIITVVAFKAPISSFGCSALEPGCRFWVRYSKWGTHNQSLPSGFNQLQANSFRMTKCNNVIHPLIEHKRSGYPRGLVTHKIHSPSIQSYRSAKLDENRIFKLFLNSLPLKEPS